MRPFTAWGSPAFFRLDRHAGLWEELVRWARSVVGEDLVASASAGLPSFVPFGASSLSEPTTVVWAIDASKRGHGGLTHARVLCRNCQWAKRWAQ